MGAFHAYDIRGIYNVDFDRETAYKVGYFIPELLGADTVLVSHVVEGSGNAGPAVRPVAVDVGVLPHVEVIAVEVVAGQRAPLLRHFADGRPPAELLGVVVREVGIGLQLGTEELLLERCAGDEEVVVGVVAVDGVVGDGARVARLPTTVEEVDEVNDAGVAEIDVHVVRRHGLSAGGEHSAGGEG